MRCIKPTVDKLIFQTLLLTVLAWSVIGSATTVRMVTSLGNIDIELFDSAAPLTVANFMNYVNDGDYDGSFIHRSVPGFIVQGGGFAYTGAPRWSRFHRIHRS